MNKFELILALNEFADRRCWHKESPTERPVWLGGTTPWVLAGEIMTTLIELFDTSEKDITPIQTLFDDNKPLDGEISKAVEENIWDLV